MHPLGLPPLMDRQVSMFGLTSKRQIHLQNLTNLRSIKAAMPTGPSGCHPR